MLSRAVRPVAEKNGRRDEINLGQPRRRSFRDKETAAFTLFLRFPRSSPHSTLERQSNRKRTDDTRNRYPRIAYSRMRRVQQPIILATIHYFN